MRLAPEEDEENGGANVVNLEETSPKKSEDPQETEKSNIKAEDTGKESEEAELPQVKLEETEKETKPEVGLFSLK